VKAGRRRTLGRPNGKRPFVVFGTERTGREVGVATIAESYQNRVGPFATRTDALAQMGEFGVTSEQSEPWTRSGGVSG
jgi:hypothetical protein